MQKEINLNVTTMCNLDLNKSNKKQLAVKANETY